MTRHIGIYGGLFDPVHRGHVAVANAACAELDLDEMHIVPCHIPNHKQVTHCAARHRLKMLQLATQAYPKLTINEIELERAQTSYSIDTVKAFSSAYPGAILVFILGADSFAGLKQWHRWQELLELCQFYVFSRPGTEIPAQFCNEPLRAAGNYRQQAQSGESYGGVWASESLALDVSSSRLRKHLLGFFADEETEAEEKRVSTESSYLIRWLDPAVLKYIVDNELYGSLKS